VPRKMALVNYRKCRPQSCAEGKCAAALACPHKLIRQDAPYETPMPDPAICRGCAKCAVACPHKAIELM